MFPKKSVFTAGLDASSWAPLRGSYPAYSTSTAPTKQQDPTRKLSSLVDRLTWKSELLLASRHIAMNSNPSNVFTMFKLDFYEYYGLLERTIVLALSSFGIVVDSKGKTPSIWGHRYHANVLDALDRPANPLHRILGEQPVRKYLGIAKEFRNRWKAADEVHEGLLAEETGILGPHLDELLKGILLALRRVVGLLKERQSMVNLNDHDLHANGLGLDAPNAGILDGHIEEMPWEAVEDAMEWE